MWGNLLDCECKGITFFWNDKVFFEKNEKNVCFVRSSAQFLWAKAPKSVESAVSLTVVEDRLH